MEKKNTRITLTTRCGLRYKKLTPHFAWGKVFITLPLGVRLLHIHPGTKV